MTTARVFKSGNSQAARPSNEFRVNVVEVDHFQRVEEIAPRAAAVGLEHAFELLTMLPDDFLSEGRQDAPPGRL